MTFGFHEPNIHRVHDVTAEARTIHRNDGSGFSVLAITFHGLEGATADMNVFFDESFAGRAHDIAEAINASKIVSINQAAE